MARAFWKALALAVGLSGTAHSHEFVAKPAELTVPAGAELQVAGLSTHIFLISQELEAPKTLRSVTAWMVSAPTDFRAAARRYAKRKT